MDWFVVSLITMLCWGLADLYYKKGTDESDVYSHLKIAVWVGIVMGICAFALLPFSETGFSFNSFISSAVKYSPASLSYILSMVIGYAGMRYLEVSIISPIQNASGALSTITMAVYFAIMGTMSSFWDEFSVLDVVGTVFIVVGVIALAAVEKYLSDKRDPESTAKNSKLAKSALALIFPITYCIFDTIGTAADGIILDEEAGLGLGEIDVLILYGMTFMLFGLASWIFLFIKTRKPYNPLSGSEMNKCLAAVCEEGGQVFYVFAMASKPMLAAPMIASYCIVSVILSRVFIKEKLKLSQYACVFLVIVGIVILGISEGISY